MPRRAYRIAALLFVSGLCALIYQVAWLRELRLVFGASTPATSAVLAVFMGGLGYGSLKLGRRAEAVARPLHFYGNLEGGIALTAALSPLLLDLARRAYVVTGGTTSLGMAGGTLVRLVLSAIVLLPPTLLMGGTLPAAARAATGADDTRRRSTALLYGVNTLGAVTGATLSTFLLLELLGTRMTLWAGCALNGIVAVVARAYDRSLAERGEGAGELAGDDEAAEDPATYRSKPPASEDEPSSRATAVAPYVLAASAGSGFVFLLMELVWYRMLGPLLGGSSYTFGLILAVALLGIGLGGLLYTQFGRDRPFGFDAFAVTCGLEALCLTVPWALGDRVALFALFLRPLGTTGFVGFLLSWTLVTFLVVLPAAIVAGFQFPLLIGLLGRAQRSVGRDVGLAYAFNTLGAILGSLAGGFLLLPILSALGAWKLCVVVLVVLGVAALAVHRGQSGRGDVATPSLLMVLTLLLLFGSVGPTAFWRHTPIGAGRADSFYSKGTKNDLKWHTGERRRAVTWEQDGRESAVALYTLNDTSFLVNGKSDGAAVTDAGTQVMGGLLGALLQPEPVKTAMVIGLGTGSTAGWLGALPDIERVDVVELEPAILHVAEVCAPVNQRVLDNPKVAITIADAREVLLTTPRRYDLIFSEPSNPYRAGIASLFTQEFYEAVRDRLTPGGVFLQWVQAYEIDSQSIRIVYATLSSVFGSIETWRTKSADLILVARMEPVPLDLDRLRARVAQSPYREALLHAWRVDSAEGVLSRFVAGPGLAREVAAREPDVSINRDDRNILEFSIARALGRPHDLDVAELVTTASALGEGFPQMMGDLRSIRWDHVYEAATSLHLVEDMYPQPPPNLEPNVAARRRMQAKTRWRQGEIKRVLSNWEAQPADPLEPMGLLVLADAYAQRGDDRALPLIAQMRNPVEADAVLARLRHAQDDPVGAWEALERAIVRYRTEPWASSRVMTGALPIAVAVAGSNPELARTIHDALGVPFAVNALHYLRVQQRLDIALMLDEPSLCVNAVREIGTPYPWYQGALEQRVRCYERSDHPALELARAELAEYLSDGGLAFGTDLMPSQPSPRIGLVPEPFPDVGAGGAGGASAADEEASGGHSGGKPTDE